MSKDPLGIERLIEQTEQSHKQTPISKDQYEAWLNHPVTKRMHEEFAITAHQSKEFAGDLECASNILVLNQVIDWEPKEMTDD